MRPKRVGVIRGGESAEREVSLKSGKAVEEALASAPCEVVPYDTSRDLGVRLMEDQIDVVFIALHGRGGEDGVIQGLLEWYDVPYTGPGVAASALCMDKIRCKQVYDGLGFPSPDWFVLRQEDPPEPRASFEQYVVKPRLEGSSLGLSIVDRSRFEEAVTRAREYDSEVLVERYIPGYEVTVGTVILDKPHVLPPVGIRPKHEFFDYDTKYTKGLTEYDVPAELDTSTRDRLEELTSTVAREFGSRSLCRIDYIVGDGGQPHLLEINTIPGFTETSLLPKAARLAGIDFPDLVWSMVRRAYHGSAGRVHA